MRARNFAIKAWTCAVALWSVAFGSGANAHTVDHKNGFAERTELITNGNVAFPEGRLRLTDAASGGVSSVFTAYHVNITRFQTSFTFQITNPGADGMAFVIQRVGAHALGEGGGGLGCYRIPDSVAVKFDFYPNDNDPWWSSTGVFTEGELPFGGDAVEPSGIDFRSGHVFRADINYGKEKLKLTITDTATNARFSKEYTLNISSIVGGDTAFVGFTGATGGFTATQDVLTWEYRAPSPVAPYYTMTNLGTPQGGGNAFARAINNAGQVMGHFLYFGPPFFEFQDHTSLYTNSAMTNITPTWAGANQYGFALNDRGFVVGADGVDTASGSAFAYVLGDRVGLPMFGNDFSSAAYGINEIGEIVGVSTNVNGLPWFMFEIGQGRGYATAWAGGTSFRMPVPANTEFSAAYDLNNKASATGWFKRFGSNERRAVLWTAPGLTPQELPVGAGEGWAINDYNEVTGFRYELSGAMRAFKLDDRGQVWNLHSSNFFHSIGMGLNNLGEVVGGWTTVYTPDHRFQGTTERAVYFTNSGGVDLNTRVPENSGVTLVEAVGINDKGQIAATGRFATSSARPFLLTPTNPVPTITSTSPNSAVAGAGPVQMTVNGSKFSPTSVLLWNGSARETLFISESQLIVPISHTDVFNIGTATIQIYTAAPGGGVSNTVNFPIVARQIQGTIALENCATPSQQVSLWFQADTGESFSRTVTLNANGTFTLDVPARQYTLWIKGAKWLAKVVSVNATQGNASVNVSLHGGDANNDNSVDVLDLDVLIQGFDSVPGNSNWDAGADLNCDQSVDVLDLDLLIRNFDQVGD